MERSSLVAVVAALVLSMALSSNAWASCNSIPDAESTEIGTFEELASQDPMMEVPSFESDSFGFEGALGTIDRFTLIPGQTTLFRVRPGNKCVQAAENQLTVRRLPGEPDPLHPVASLLTRPAGGGDVQALILGSEELCHELVPGFVSEASEHHIALSCDAQSPKLDPQEEGPPIVWVSLPDDYPQRGSATVVLTDGLRSPSDHLALLSKIAADGCAAQCETLLEMNTVVCIDYLYHTLNDGTVIHDKVPCEVTIPGCDPSQPNCPNPTIQKNDFQALCEDLVPAPAGLAQCANDPNRPALEFWEDSCGGVHIPFDWTGIRKDLSTITPTDITRVVAGRTATSRIEKGKLNTSRIWVPGREFLGSTPWGDPSAKKNTTNWRRPDIDVWYPNGSPEEFGLRGSVDKPDSIVHVYPRMAASLICWNGSQPEGCMGVDDDGNISCECGDRYPAGCECDDATPPMYFECKGGDFEGMPCTRHSHCNSAVGSSKPDGTCSQRPKCQPPGKVGVWMGSPSAGQDCWYDSHCPQSKECGHRLFYVGDRKDTPSKPDLILLDAKIPDPSGHERRGVCSGDRGQTCNQQSPRITCDATDGDCRGYTLRAENKK